MNVLSCGYGAEYDEWKPRSEVVYCKLDFSRTGQQYSSLTVPSRSSSNSGDLMILKYVYKFPVTLNHFSYIGTICNECGVVKKYRINNEILGEVASEGCKFSW